MSEQLWTSPAWLDEVAAWIESEVPLTGEPELLRAFAWAAVVRAPTKAGNVYFKSCAPVCAFEPPLTLLVARLRPDCTPEVVAADINRRWVLTRDAGRPLSELLRETPKPRLVEEAFALYADLQIAAIDHVGEALGFGTPDARPGRLRAAYAEIVGDRRLMPACGVSEAEQTRLRELTIRVDELAADVGDIVPDSVAHEEAHEANTFIRDGRIRILDWGDAGVGNPFTSLTGPLRSYGWRFGVAPGDPLLARLRDAYLDAWTAFAPRAKLVDVFAAAYQLGMVCRIVSYARSLSELDAATNAPTIQGLTLWLRAWLAAAERPATLGV